MKCQCGEESEFTVVCREDVAWNVRISEGVPQWDRGEILGAELGEVGVIQCGDCGAELELTPEVLEEVTKLMKGGD